MKFLSVCSTRPNFIKLAAIHHALRAQHIIVHTGQHYDPLLSDVFFEQLALPEPDFNLGIHGGTNEDQQSRVEAALTPVLTSEKPDIVIVYGDVNGAVAAARAAHALSIPVAHVEAGLRSFNLSMPEERNRIEIDRLSTFLFVTEQSGIDNLAREGITQGVHFVGNTMIDTLIRLLPTIDQEPVARYAVATFHRPSNVDDPAELTTILDFLGELSSILPVIFPAHPRTRINQTVPDSLHVIDPLPYLEFLRLVKGSQFVLTDSGGIQEETTYLGKKCFTARPDTERPVTITLGTNTLVNLHDESDRQAILKWAADPTPIHWQIPTFWDGHAAEDICRILHV